MGGELVEVGEVNFVRLEVAVIAGNLPKSRAMPMALWPSASSLSQTARPMPELAPVTKTRISDL